MTSSLDTNLDKTITQKQAEQLIKDKQAEFFPNRDYLFIGTRDEKGYMHEKAVYKRDETDKNDNFHLHWPTRQQVMQNLVTVFQNLETFYLKGNTLTQEEVDALVRQNKAISAKGQIIIMGQGTGIGVFNKRNQDGLYHLTYTPFKQEMHSDRR